MREPAFPPDEGRRLDALCALDLLDTPADERFDRLTRLARSALNVPIALVSLIDGDRQWFKSRQGLDTAQTSRMVSFCGHAILHDDVLVVPDALADERFADNPLVTAEPHVRFYAGCPLHAPGRERVGTLCVIDREPRALEAAQIGLLKDLARLVEREMAASSAVTVDRVTRLSNRRGFLQLGRYALTLCARAERNATLVSFSLAGLRDTNRRFGRAEGDCDLAAFAAMLARTYRDSDVIGRIGGTRFGVLLTHCDRHDARGSLSRLQHLVNRHNQAEGRAHELAFDATVLPYEPIRHGSIRAMLDDADAVHLEHEAVAAAT